MEAPRGGAADGLREEVARPRALLPLLLLKESLSSRAACEMSELGRSHEKDYTTHLGQLWVEQLRLERRHLLVLPASYGAVSVFEPV